MEVLADQLSAKFPDLLVLGNTDLVRVDDTFPLGSPGTQFKIPSWKRIPAFASLTEGTAMTPGKITSYAEFATVTRAGAAFEVYDTAELVSKADPVSEIADQIARRAAEYIDAKLVLQAEHTPNTYSVAATLDQNVLITAITSTLGDNYGALLGGSGVIVMHSKVFADLIKTGAIQNLYQGGFDVLKTGLLPSLLGMRVIQSDLVTTATISAATNYHTYILGRDALALFYQREVIVEFDRDILLQADIIAGSVHFSPHLFGYDDQTTAIVAEQNKSIHAVVVNTL
jgi:hypothetical protein